MQNWHFKISARVIIPGDSSTMEIKPENFMNIIRISDYQNSNMPTIMLRLNIDKNLFDKIISNAKTANIFLKIEKFDKQDDTNADPVCEPYIEDVFSIFVSNDINYNKEIDYKDTDKDQKPKEDVYIQTYIGLINKACISANKVTSNHIISETPMMDIVASYLKRTHLLIKPFTYNKTMAQLIIPPKDTLSEIIKYLNSVQVFYDFQYMFFIEEPSCTYLLPRDGKGLEKSDEKYNTVLFDLHKADDKQAATIGMKIDDEHKQYYVDINVLDTKYTIDHDTAKIIDTLQAIINPNKDNTINSLEDVQNAIAKIQSYIGSLNIEVNKFIQNMGANLNEKLSNISINVNHTVLDKMQQLKEKEKETLDKYIKSIDGMPTTVDVKDGDDTVTVPIVSEAAKNAAKGFLNSTFDKLQGYHKQLEEASGNLANINNGAIKLSYRIVDITNETNAVTAENQQNVTKTTKKKMAQLGIDCSGLVSQLTSKIVPTKLISSSFTNSAMDMTTKALDFYKQLHAVQTGGYGHLLPGSLTGSFDQNKQLADQMQQNHQDMKTESDNYNKHVDSYHEMAQNMNKASQRINTFKDTLDVIDQLNLKGKFGNIVTDTRKLVDKGAKMFDKWNNATQNTISYADVLLGKYDLSQVKDLTGIGKLGLSIFETNLAVGNIFGTGILGTKIIKTRNDNPNEIKNVKSELETMVNQLSINKYDLDPSVFTPNKKYIVKNYDAHSDKDGMFILNKKTELFVREDTTFTCNTLLDFAKVPDPNTDKAKDNTTAGTNNTQQEKWYSKSTGQDDLKNNEDVNTNTSGSGDVVHKEDETPKRTQTVLGTGSVFDIMRS